MPSSRDRITVRPLAEQFASWREGAARVGMSMNEWLCAAADAALETSPGAASLPGVEKQTPVDQPAAASSPSGCWDHRGAPKSWCQYCKV